MLSLSARRRLSGSATALALAVLAAAAVGGDLSLVPKADAASGPTPCSSLEIVAHRGYHSGSIIENTLAAYREAARRGFSIETDVWADTDGQLWIFHDRDVERLTGSRGSIGEMTTAEVAALRFTRGGGALPRFEEAVAVWAEHPETRVYLEPKNGDSGLSSARILAQAGLTSSVIYTASQPLVMKAFPEFQTLRRLGRDAESPAIYQAAGLDYVSFSPRLITSDLVDSFHDVGIEVQGQTKNGTVSWRQTIAGGADGQLLDAVDRLVEFCPVALLHPTVSSFSPSSAKQGTTITISGSGFTDATSVRFGNAANTNFTVDDTGESVTVTVPADAAVSSRVRVITPNGTADSADQFTVVAQP